MIVDEFPGVCPRCLADALVWRDGDAWVDHVECRECGYEFAADLDGLT